MSDDDSFNCISKMGTCSTCGIRFKDVKRHYNLSKACSKQRLGGSVAGELPQPAPAPANVSLPQKVWSESEDRDDVRTHFDDAPSIDPYTPISDSISKPTDPPVLKRSKRDLTDIELAIAQFKYEHNLSVTAANDLCKLVSKIITLTKGHDSSSTDTSFTRRTFTGIEKKIDHLQKRKTVLDAGDFLEEAWIPAPSEVKVRHPEIETLYVAYNNPSRWVRDISKRFKPEEFLETMFCGNASVDDFDSGDCWRELQEDVTKIHGPGIKMLPLQWFRDGAAASRGTRSVTPITVTVAGLKRDVRNSVKAKHLAGYEAVYGDISHPDAQRAAKDAIFNFLLCLLDELESTPFVLDFGVPYAPVRVCVRHLMFLGDHPEANPEAGVSGSLKANYPCRDCEVRNEDLYKTSFASGCYPALRDWSSIDQLRWNIKLNNPTSTSSLQQLESKNISATFSGSHAAYGCKSPVEVDSSPSRHLGTRPNLRIPYEILHAWLLGLPKRLCLLVADLIKQPEPNRVRAEGVTIEFCLEELDRRVRLFKACKRGKGSGENDFFKKETTTLLRWILLRTYDIGKEMFALGKPWNATRRLAFSELLKDYGDNFYQLFHGVSKCRFIKNHLLIHLERDFARFGSPMNYIAHSFERSMVEFVRTVFARTNAEKSPKTEKRMLLEIIRRLMIADEVVEREMYLMQHTGDELHEDEEEEPENNILETKESNVVDASADVKSRLLLFQATLVMGRVQPSTGNRDWFLKDNTTKRDAGPLPFFTLCPVNLESSDVVSQRAVIRRIGRIVERSFEHNAALRSGEEEDGGVWFWDTLINSEREDISRPACLQMYKGVDLGGGFKYRCDNAYPFNRKGSVGPRYDFIRVKPSPDKQDLNDSWVAQLLAVFLPVSAGTGKIELGVLCLIRYMLQIKKSPSGLKKRKRDATVVANENHELTTLVSESKYAKRAKQMATKSSTSALVYPQVTVPSPPEIIDDGCHSRFRHFMFELEKESKRSTTLSFKYDCVKLEDIHHGIGPAYLFPDISFNKGKVLKEHRYYEVMYY